MDHSIRIVYRSTLYQNLDGTGRLSVDCRVLILINAWNTFKVNALVVIVKYDSLGTCMDKLDQGNLVRNRLNVVGLLFCASVFSLLGARFIA